jgi:ketosteroid isomerase-like protein
VVSRYFAALDERDWAALDGVFAAGAVLVYDMGVPARSTYPEMLELFRSFCEQFVFTQHLASAPLVELDGDRARARTKLRAVHVQEDAEGARNTWIVYGVYDDVLARAPAGWRIVERRFRSLHLEGTLWPASRVGR